MRLTIITTKALDQSIPGLFCVQIRRAVYDGPYTNLLGELAKGDAFQKMVGGKGMAASEKDQEFVLRFLALQRNGPKMFKGGCVSVAVSCSQQRHV